MPSTSYLSTNSVKDYSILTCQKLEFLIYSWTLIYIDMALTLSEEILQLRHPSNHCLQASSSCLELETLLQGSPSFSSPWRKSSPFSLLFRFASSSCSFTRARHIAFTSTARFADCRTVKRVMNWISNKYQKQQVLHSASNIREMPRDNYILGWWSGFAGLEILWF